MGKKHKKHKKSEHMDDTIHYEVDPYNNNCADFDFNTFQFLGNMRELKQTPYFAPCGHVIAEPFYCPFATPQSDETDNYYKDEE